MKRTFGTCLLASLALATAALARPASDAVDGTYTMDPQHTYPSFEADHMGLSVWRGKFNHSHGTVTLDRAHRTGRVDVTVDTASVDFGLDALNAKAKTSMLLDTTRYPHAHYTGRLAGFVDGAPTRVVGKLTLHGVTRPLTLKILSFKCMPHPVFKREVCGADALARFDRSRFGMDAGKDYGFDMTVTLRIQVEALHDE